MGEEVMRKTLNFNFKDMYNKDIEEWVKMERQQVVIMGREKKKTNRQGLLNCVKWFLRVVQYQKIGGLM